MAFVICFVFWTLRMRRRKSRTLAIVSCEASELRSHEAFFHLSTIAGMETNRQII